MPAFLEVLKVGQLFLTLDSCICSNYRHPNHQQGANLYGQPCLLRHAYVQSWYSSTFLTLKIAIAGNGTKIYPLPTSSDLLQYWIAENAESTSLMVLNLRNTPLKEEVTIPNGFTFARIIRMNSEGGALSLSKFNIGGVDFNLKASEGSASYGEEILTLAGNGEIPFEVAAESAILIRMSSVDLGAVLPPDIVEGDGAFSGSLARPAASLFAITALLVLAF
jgi:hypothetical protein